MQSTVDWSDYPPVDYSHAAIFARRLRQSTFSQELRLSSADPSATLIWIAGAFYSAERTHEVTRVITPLGDVGNENATLIDQSQLEGFGQIGLRMSQRFIASAGCALGARDMMPLNEVPRFFHAEAAEAWVTPRYSLLTKPMSTAFFT